MNENERLQKAVELTIGAGYHLNKDAFEFLKMVASTMDPQELMKSAVGKLTASQQKPLFIEKSFLEELINATATSTEFETQPEAGIESTVESRPQLTEAKRPFHPYAKEVEQNIQIIDDPGAKLSSGGKLENYLEYFRDRFRRMEKLLRQRIDVRSAASVVDALKSPKSARVKIIVMIMDKRDSRHRTILTVEDLHAGATAIVPQNAPQEVQRKARSLLPDQVVCLDVAKTGGSLLIVHDIILPDVAQRTQHKSSLPVSAVLTSDMHVGSVKFQRDSLNRFILWLNGKYGDDKMRQIAGSVKYVLIAGDIVDGIGIYPNQVKELAIKDVHRQYRLAAAYLEQIPDYIEVVIIPGNHDASRKALPQPPIAKTYLETLEESRKIMSLGSPSLLSLHTVEVLMFHGRSLDDVISTVPDMTHEHPERAMRLLLQCRHLAPLYGGKTPLSPEDRDPLVIERVPDVFHAGHIHALEYGNYRGVLVMNSGCWQDQTGYMQRNGFVPTPGKVPVVDLQTLGVTLIPFN